MKLRSFGLFAFTLLISLPSQADEEICFINNASQAFSFEYDYQTLLSIPANGGDQNSCVSVATINGQSGTGDSAASYYEGNWRVPNADFSLSQGTIIYPNGSSVQMANLPSLNGLGDIQPVFLNPVIGEGTFYWANPWRNVSDRTITSSSIIWEENDKWCNTLTCFHHKRGDDGIYRVWMADKPPAPQPQPAPEDCSGEEGALDDWCGF